MKFNLTLKRKTHDKKITPIFYSSDKKYKTLHLKYNCCPVAIYCDIIYPENPRAAVNIHNKCNIGCPNEIVLERPKKCGAYSVWIENIIDFMWVNFNKVGELCVGIKDVY